MILRLAASLLLASCILITGCATSPTLWKASDISRRSETHIQLTHDNETLATVETSTIRKLVETKERIEKAAGVGYAELVIAPGDEPNAFAGNHPKLGRIVGINTGMLKLIGTDWDGYAAIIGHEYAHHALRHSATRTQREAVRQGIATAVGIALGAAGVPMGGTIADIGTMAVATVYSRDEEREADRKGFEYMVQAGLDPQGAVRVWEKMNALGTGALIPFLSTHPMSSERVNNMRTLIIAHQTTQVSIGIAQFRKPTVAEEQQGGQEVPAQANLNRQEELAVASPAARTAPLALVAPAPRVAARDPSADPPADYNGRWAAEISCRAFGARPAFASSIPFSVSDNAFSLQHGELDKPGSFQLSGTADSDGRLQLTGEGIAIGGRWGTGQPFKAAFDGKFAGEHYEAAGQLGAQQCTVTISKAE